MNDDWVNRLEDALLEASNKWPSHVAIPFPAVCLPKQQFETVLRVHKERVQHTRFERACRHGFRLTRYDPLDNRVYEVIGRPFVVLGGVRVYCDPAA